jgi:hypothetical protein
VGHVHAERDDVRARDHDFLCRGVSELKNASNEFLFRFVDHAPAGPFLEDEFELLLGDAGFPVRVTGVEWNQEQVACAGQYQRRVS